METRKEKLLARFREEFGAAEVRFFSAPGRTEICGNHTDHQHGKVLAGAVNTDILAAAAPNGTQLARVKSEGYELFTVELDSLEPDSREFGSSKALVRGICAEIVRRGYTVAGFDACITSDVLQGSGLSSSAAFEVLIAGIVSCLFCGGALTATELAQIGQRAENIWFGKPCGLMDQMASAWGGIITIDFRDPAAPVVEPVGFDFAAAGHSLCIVDVRADHANLTHEYAAIPAELRAVCSIFGKDYLRDVDEAAFYARLAEVRKLAGDRAVLRAIHVFNENRRVEGCCAALRNGSFGTFLDYVNQSGRSSRSLLQNVVVSGSTASQSAALALALCEQLLHGRGAYRIHGGGFGGTVQAFVPDELVADFRDGIESVFGEGSCHCMRIRSTGFTEESAE